MRILSRTLSRLTLKIPDNTTTSAHPSRRNRLLPPATTLQCSVCNKYFRVRFSCSDSARDSFMLPSYQCINCDLKADCFRLGRTEEPEAPDYTPPAPVAEPAPEPVPHRAIALAASRLRINTVAASAPQVTEAQTRTPLSPPTPISGRSWKSPLSPTIAQPDYRMRPRTYVDFEQIYGGRDYDTASVWSSDCGSPGDSQEDSPVEADWPPIIPGVLTVRNPDPPSPGDEKGVEEKGGEEKGDEEKDGEEIARDKRIARIKEVLNPVSTVNVVVV